MRAHDPSTEPPLAPGDLVLDRYRVVEHIATGGHSVIFRGRDERLQRPVCIKVFSRYPGDPGISQTSYEHFVQEAFALSRLTHPNTLRIYDFGHLADSPGDDGAVPFHVSEFMNGGTLARLVREGGAQPSGDVVKIATAIADALAEAHSLGIIHRDLKPQNILFAAFGTTRLPKLADFGIAKWLEHDVTDDGGADEVDRSGRAGDTQVVSGQRMAMYSPSWAAPEQLAGTPVGPSADIYSLALLVVYMLTGRSLFADDDVYEAYGARRTGPEAVAEALAPLGLPDDVVALLGQALAFEPDERPDEAGRFGTDLADAFEPTTGEPARVEPAGGSRPHLTAVDGAPAEAGPTRAAARPPRRVTVSEVPVPVAGRSARFATARDGTADVVGLRGTARLRLTLLPAVGNRRPIHVKGLSCFVARSGGRPSVAVQVDGDALLDLIGPGSAPLGRVRISIGAPAAGHTVFRFGDDAVAIGYEECPEVVLVDFGSGAECTFVYRAGRGSTRGLDRRGRG